MPVALAERLVALAAVYGLLGLLFAIPFVSIGIGKIDSRAQGAGLGFRLLVLPGVAALWPLLLFRWLGNRNAGNSG
jgi:hypothetical protein